MNHDQRPGLDTMAEPKTAVAGPQATPDTFVAQFDATTTLSQLKRLQDPSKFSKAKFKDRLYDR